MFEKMHLLKDKGKLRMKERIKRDKNKKRQDTSVVD